MTKKLKISDIISGTEKAEACYLESLKGDVYLRPLSQKELDELSEIEARAIGEFETNEKANNRRRRTRREQLQSQMESRGKLNVLKNTQATNEIRVTAVRYSLDNSHYKDEEESITIENLLNAKGGVLDEIYKHVRRISGMDDDNAEETVDEFPGDG